MDVRNLNCIWDTLSPLKIRWDFRAYTLKIHIFVTSLFHYTYFFNLNEDFFKINFLETFFVIFIYLPNKKRVAFYLNFCNV